MTGQILKDLIMVLVCCIAAQTSGAVTADPSSRGMAAKLERIEVMYESHIQNQQTQILDLKFQLQKQSQIIAQQAKLVVKQGKRIDDVELENQSLAERIGEIELENMHQQNNFVSFTASPSVTRSYNTGDRLLFDSVLTNYGNSYESGTSIFTCSVNGYYLFSVTVRTNGDADMHGQIQLDNTPLVSAYAHDWDTGSSMMVIQCGVGQTVWIMCQNGPGHVLFDDVAYRWSSFSGTLLSLA